MLYEIFAWGTYNSFAALSAAPATFSTTPIDGSVGNVVMSGVSTKWYYDATLAVFRINDKFVTTSSVFDANTKLAGMQDGDFATASDTGQVAQWNNIQGSYTYVS